MTVKEFLGKAGKSMLGAAKKIGKLILEAKTENIIKFGILIGTVVVVGVSAIIYLKNRYRVYNDEDNKSTVDRALQINFTDLRNQEELSPIMKEVSKNLNRELKPRIKNGAYRNNAGETWKDFGRKFDSIRKSEKRRQQIRETGPVALSELRRFERDMEDLEFVERSQKGKKNNFALRTAWENA